MKEDGELGNKGQEGSKGGSRGPRGIGDRKCPAAQHAQGILDVRKVVHPVHQRAVVRIRDKL